MIAFILSRAEGGGLELVMSRIASALAERGADCRLVVGHRIGSGGLFGEVEEIAPEGPLTFLMKLPFWIRHRRPEVVVTSSNDVACFLLLLSRIWRRGPAVVVTQHLSISGPLTHARAARKLKLRLLRRLMRWLYPLADARVAVSRAVADDMVAELGLKRDSIEVIHNPVLSDAEVEAVPVPLDDWPWSDRGVPVLVFAGRLSSEKRPDLLMSAFERVRARREIRMLVLGDGPLAGWLKDQCGHSEWTRDIALMGRVESVMSWMAGNDVLVLPSDYEGFGNVLVEAMHAGLQIVATDCPSGPGEVLDNGLYGHLVPVGDLDALVQGIEGVLDGRFHMDPRVLRARAAQFTVTPAADRYAELIQSIRMH